MLPLISELKKRLTSLHNKTGTSNLSSLLTYSTWTLIGKHISVIKASIALGHVIYTKITVFQRLSHLVKVNFNLALWACHLTGHPPG